jgi:prepilin-type N-terminal cleavage/methylation domain-containing protein
MLKARKGFTLIELLIVIVIIGILAAIAIPKFGKTREKAYFKAMQSDLRNLQSQQEIYFSNPANSYQYSNATSNLPDFVPSQGVTVGIAAAANTGWSATASHQALAAGQICSVFINGAAAVAPATTPGIVTCTGE